MLVMARTTTGWTKNTSCASTISAMKNSNSVPVKVNPMISLMDEVSLCFMTVITARASPVCDQQIQGIFLSRIVSNLTSMKRNFISSIP